MLRLFAGIQSDRGMAFVFRFGCFTLVDFSPGETRSFLEAMRAALPDLVNALQEAGLHPLYVTITAAETA